WLNSGSMNYARRQHKASVLPSGKVLVTGGYNGPALESTELYDSSAEIWTVTNSMNHARRDHISVLINGKVLVAGGGCDMNTRFDSAELYDPATETWTVIDSMKHARA
ncbi:unnamed protein product, partial [Adineta steineri]